MSGTYLLPWLISYFFSNKVVGSYSMAQNVLILPSAVLGTALGQVFQQKAADSLYNGNIADVSLKGFLLLWRVGMFPVLACSFLAPSVFPIIFGPEWYEAGLFAKILAPWIALGFIYSPLSSLYAVLMLQKLGLVFVCFYTFSRLVSIYIGRLDVVLTLVYLSTSGAILTIIGIYLLLLKAGNSLSMMLTHDVDEPFESLFRPTWRMIRSFGSDVIRRRDIKRAVERASLWYKVRHGDWYVDRAYTFDRLMDLSESVGCKDAFYFIPDCSGKMSGDYCLSHPAIRKLLMHIFDRGHEVGYHGSYDTYLDPRKTKNEVKYLKQVASEEGIEQERWGGRQHYLRWSAPQTWNNYEESGLDYDTTLSFADVAGFRCGTCRPYPVFDVKSRKELNLIEYPLTVMECSVLGYMGYNYEQAYDYMMMLKNQCRKYKGTFVFLWHNSAFDSEADWELYEEILRG